MMEGRSKSACSEQDSPWAGNDHALLDQPLGEGTFTIALKGRWPCAHYGEILGIILRPFQNSALVLVVEQRRIAIDLFERVAEKPGDGDGIVEAIRSNEAHGEECAESCPLRFVLCLRVATIRVSDD